MRAQARIEANTVAMYRMKRTDEVSNVRQLQRDVAGRVRQREKQAVQRRIVEDAVKAQEARE